MAQFDLATTAANSGVEFLADVQLMENAIRSTHSGSSAPSYAAAGLLWIDTTTSTLWLHKLYDGTDWILIGKTDTTNNVYYPKGTLIRTPSILTSSGTHNYHAAAGSYEVIIDGATGGGGGANSLATANGSAGSGGSTAHRVIWGGVLSDSVRTSAYTIGAAGVGVSGANGTNGGSTTFAYDGTTITVPGGLGGLVGGNSAGIVIKDAGFTAAYVPSDTEYSEGCFQGDPGRSDGTTISATAFVYASSGAGGGPNGGVPRILAANSATNSPGSDARGPRGGGGGGSCIVAAAAVKGGDGFRGEIMVREFA